MPSQPARRTRCAAGRILALILAVGSLSACGGADRVTVGPPVELRPTPARATPRALPGASPSIAVVPTRASLGAVTGRLTEGKRRRLVAEISTVAGRWMDAAFVEGDYPRSTFKDSFPGFTRGAVRSARADKALLSNADIGDRIDGVTVTRRAVRVDLLAVGGRARAGTARIGLSFTTHGVKRRVRITGRLFLIQRDGRWRVFGYDVAKGRS